MIFILQTALILPVKGAEYFGKKPDNKLHSEIRIYSKVTVT